MRMRRMLPADIPALADLASEAFWNDEVFAWIFPDRAQFPDDFKRNWVGMFRSHLYKPGWHCFVSETEEGDPTWSGRSDLTGFAMWERRGYSSVAKSWQQDSISNCMSLSSVSRISGLTKTTIVVQRLLHGMNCAYNYVFSPIRSLDQRNLQRFNEVLKGDYAEEVEGWYLLMIGVSPKHQRHGIGTSLIDWGLQRAQNESVICMLESSETVKGLYKRKGFQKVRLLEITKGITSDQMVWRPQ